MRSSPSKSRGSAIRRQAVAIAVGIAFGLIAVVPLPYFIVAPGHAIDLRERLTVEGGADSRSRFLLTDVTIARATTLGLLARFLPATAIVPNSDVMPAGQSSAAFDRSMNDAMSESQNVATFVAERAAGLRVPDDFVVRVEGFAPGSQASAALRKNDRLLSVAGRRVRGASDIAAALTGKRGCCVVVGIERSEARTAARVRAMPGPGGVRKLGVFVSSHLPTIDFPVPVRFAMDDVAGASAGLMFALQIYADLHPLAVRSIVAGTGTIAPDGSVGAIEGTPQKFEAARRAGATVFFVPTKNLADLARVAHDGIAIVAVTSFGDALRHLERAAR